MKPSGGTCLFCVRASVARTIPSSKASQNLVALKCICAVSIPDTASSTLQAINEKKPNVLGIC